MAVRPTKTNCAFIFGPRSVRIDYCARAGSDHSVCASVEAVEYARIVAGANVRFGSRLCRNSDLSIVRKNPTAQNGPQSTISALGDILQLPKTRAVGVFTQPRPRADTGSGHIDRTKSVTLRTGSRRPPQGANFSGLS